MFILPPARDIIYCTSLLTLKEIIKLQRVYSTLCLLGDRILQKVEEKSAKKSGKRCLSARRAPKNMQPKFGFAIAAQVGGSRHVYDDEVACSAKPLSSPCHRQCLSVFSVLTQDGLTPRLFITLNTLTVALKRTSLTGHVAEMQDARKKQVFVQPSVFIFGRGFLCTVWPVS